MNQHRSSDVMLDWNDFQAARRLKEYRKRGISINATEAALISRLEEAKNTKDVDMTIRDDFTTEGLRKQCTKRALSEQGTRAVLITRLTKTGSEIEKYAYVDRFDDDQESVEYERQSHMSLPDASRHYDGSTSFIDTAPTTTLRLVNIINSRVALSAHEISNYKPQAKEEPNDSGSSNDFKRRGQNTGPYGDLLPNNKKCFNGEEPSLDHTLFLVRRKSYNNVDRQEPLDPMSRVRLEQQLTDARQAILHTNDL